MKGSELRIGNIVWLKSKNKPYAISSGHDIGEIDDAPEGFDALPIELSEEWMLKFGFLKSKGRFGSDYDMVRNKYDVYFTIEHWSDPPEDSEFYNFWFCKYALKPNKLKYVHQLQNLFFAITGEELNYKI